MFPKEAHVKARLALKELVKTRPRLGGRFLPLPKVEWKCEICGKLVSMLPSEARLRSKRFCSEACYHESRIGTKISRAGRLNISKALQGKKRKMVIGHHPSPNSEQIRAWIQRHDGRVMEVLETYRSQNLRVIPLIHSRLPDGIVIDFDHKIVMAIEVGSHSRIEVETSFPWANISLLFPVQKAMVVTR